MPVRYEILLELERPEDATPDRLHALVTSWLERSLSEEAHRRNVKPFSLGRLRAEAGAHALEIGLLDDSLVACLLEGADEASRRGLPPGRLRGRVLESDGQPAKVVASAPWSQLAAGVSRSMFTFEFETPTTFRQGNDSLPLPLPTLVFGHYRNRWRAFAPSEHHLDIDFQGIGLFVARHAIRTAHTTVRGVRFVGFTGTVGIGPRHGGETIGRALDSLASIARFCGTGSLTTFGMGSTRRVLR
jgi:hypothetical protein